MDGIHDLGGMHGFGTVVVPGGDAPYHQRWEARVFALDALVGLEGLGGGPGGRATREQMDPAHYLSASYYEAPSTGSIVRRRCQPPAGSLASRRATGCVCAGCAPRGTPAAPATCAAWPAW